MGVATTNSAANATSAQQSAWGAIGAKRFATILPAGIGHGAETLLVMIDATTGALSHATGDVVDSRDWRNRRFRATAVVSGAAGKFAFDPLGGVAIAPS